MSIKKLNQKRKKELLRKQGLLNPYPEKVTDPLFREENEFFDPLDMVQVKYEMLRQVKQEDQSISHACQAFGFSRPSFYEAKKSYSKSGLAGLLPKKRGPQGAHKLTKEIMAVIREELRKDQPPRSPELARTIRERFGIKVHPRSIERALAKNKKKTDET